MHDAILIEAPLDELDQVIERTKDIMAEASAIVLGGFRLGSDAEMIRYPDRYSDERGVKMWDTVTSILDRLDQPTCSPVSTPPAHQCTATCSPMSTRPILLSYIGILIIWIPLILNFWHCQNPPRN